MECDICHRGYSAKRLPFLCAVDARNAVYEHRMQNLQLLFETDRLQNQIQDAQQAAHGGVVSEPCIHLDALAQQQRLQIRTDEILAAAERLREDILTARDEVRERQAALSRRRSDLASVTDGLRARRTAQQQDLMQSIGSIRLRWSHSAGEMARTRAFLCVEALRLYGLKRSRKGGAGRYEYHIGRVLLVDPLNLESLPPEVISTSLAHVSHLLLLLSQYLAIRLPAQISPPRLDDPRPMIFNISGSYQHHRRGSRADSTGSAHASRPRPLFLDRPLQQMAKDDPTGFMFFLEGVALLAYDIAWLCSSQGVYIGEKASFEDVCNMGRNIYSFLLAAQAQWLGNQPLSKAQQDAATEHLTASPQASAFGRYSHGTVFYFLNSAEGNDLVRRFKFPSPVKLADQLKRRFLGDAPSNDWEVLDSEAWKVEAAPDEPGPPKHDAALGGQREYAQAKASPRTTGLNGWTRVKARS